MPIKLPSISLKKFVLVSLIIVLPIICLFIFLGPIIQSRTNSHSTFKYVLSQDFSRQNLLELIPQLSRDQEFVFYFNVLPQDHIERAFKETYDEVGQNRSAAALKELVVEGQRKVTASAMLINTLDFDENFIVRPEQHPALCRSVWSFIYDEFKVSLVTLIYKALVDSSYSLGWNSVSIGAANQVIQLFESIPENQLENMRAIFLQFGN